MPRSSITPLSRLPLVLTQENTRPSLKTDLQAQVQYQVQK